MYIQVKEPNDFRQWRETMETEFPSRFKRLFTGPMWSGQGKDVTKDPKDVRCHLLILYIYI